MTVDLICDTRAAAKDKLLFVKQDFNSTACNMNLVYRTSKGCPVMTKGKVTGFIH